MQFGYEDVQTLLEYRVTPGWHTVMTAPKFRATGTANPVSLLLRSTSDAMWVDRVV